jgi:nuclear pore complex protein Nup155
LHSVAYYPGLSLSDRLGYLTNAIAHARSSSGANTQEILNRIQDEVDLARVQLDLATQLATIPDAEEILPEVNEELLDAKRLFLFAKNFELNEITLKVLFVSDRGGIDGKLMTLVEHLWTRIIEDIIQLSMNPLESLCDKIKELGRSFYPDETIFPLKYLISKLEHVGFENAAKFGGKLPWVIQTLLDIKVPFGRLFGVYQELYDSKLPPWSSNKALVYLIQNMAYLLEEWFEYIRSPSVSFYEREEFPARAVDEVLSKYLVNVPHSETTLLDRLHAIQSRVRSTF